MKRQLSEWERIIANETTGKGFSKYTNSSCSTIPEKQPAQQKVGRRPKQTFSQKRQTDGQETHEKMLDTAHHQRNANQSYNEVLPHTSQNGHYQKNLLTINAGEDVEKREPSGTVGGNAN